MNPIGTIRIRSLETLLVSKNPTTSSDNLDTSNESSIQLQQLIENEVESFNHANECALTNSPSSTLFKEEFVISEAVTYDCVDLTDDVFETPVKRKQSTSKGRTTAVKSTKSKTRIPKQKSGSVIKSSGDEDTSQKKLLSFFTASSTVMRAPKKQGKPPEEKDIISNVKSTPPRKLKKLSLKRNILKDNDNDCLVKKSKASKKLNNSKCKKIQHQEELENIPEPTVIPGVIDLCLDSDEDEDIKMEIKAPKTPPKRPITVKSEKSVCPSYKVIEGTTFAVDGFKFGRIEGVTAYFLSHYHSDHYIGLTRKFSMPLYLSQITANLLREFIPIDEQYINILPLNITTTIGDVKVTAIDANHCPGAVMFLFELPCGKRILHTGDFRASTAMESDPYLSQRNIDLLYLDTTYISHNYSFQTQEKSIVDALNAVREFKARNEGKRILFAIGTYLVGKEKFWLAIAKEFNFKVWTDSNRRKIMHAIDDKEIIERLVTKSRDADMHIISMMKVGYRGIEAYWQDYSDSYDMIFAIRPSGWEKNSKPQFRGQINIVGIEYSEHSSHNELRRFLSFLKPQQVISTVPYGKDLTKCPDVPLSWYKKECFSPIKKQASLLNYFKSSKNENKIS